MDFLFLDFNEAIGPNNIEWAELTDKIIAHNRIHKDMT